MGCVTQAGEQSLHVGRNAVLASKLPQSVPAVTIDRQCGSSQQAIQFAAQAVMSGTQDVVIAAGVESMTRAPMGLSMVADKGFNPFPPSVTRKYGVPFFSQFMGAEMIAKKYGYDRGRLDEYALRSHRRAKAATEAGAFAAEIVPVEVTLPDGSTEIHKVDEGIRFDATPRRDRRGQIAQGGRRDQRRLGEPDLRRLLGGAGRLGAGAEGRTA